MAKGTKATAKVEKVDKRKADKVSKSKITVNPSDRKKHLLHKVDGGQTLVSVPVQEVEDLLNGKSLEDKILDELARRSLDDLYRGIKVESLALAQTEIARIVDWTWDKDDGLKGLRLDKAPMVKSIERDASGGLLRVENDRGVMVVPIVPSPSYIEGVIRPIVNTETQGRTMSNCMGFFSSDRFQDNTNGETLGLINYCPEFFNAKRLKYEETNALQLVETIVHECVHMLNSANGFKDCSKQRHNLKFKETAEALGLECVGDGKDKKIGWGHTKLGDKLKAEALKLEIDPEALRYFAHEIAKSSGGGRAKAVRWECPQGCGDDNKNVGFRTTSAKDFNIVCWNCSTNVVDDTNGRGKLNGTINDLVFYVKKSEGGEDDS